MSVTFTKLFSSITESTVWCEPSDIRIAWITMLAMADRHGRVFGSIPGVANRAQISVEAMQKALETFLSPDAFSRTKDHEGRRIREIDGGWALLNHGKYRAIRDEEERKAYKATKEREYRAKRGKTRGQNGLPCTDVDSNGHNADTEAYTDTVKKPSRAKRTSDPRTNEFRSALLSYWSSKNPNVDMPWDGSEAKQLSSLLAANPTLTEMAFKQLLRHRYASRGVNHAERPRSWLSRATDYAAGPLNQFKQPEGTINGRPSANLQRKQSSDEAIERAARELDDADETGAGLLPKPGNPSRYRQSLPQSVGGDY